MRIHRLDLIRYGKFTGGVIALPAAPCDFHLIVGPNEAGKSTTRAAILDLLFGIQTRPALAFLHAANELRLGASIGDAERSLEFVRIKATRQTLRGADGSVLADSALAPFLGTAERAFFDQMFGLDHPRLVAGGNSILNAEDNIGQILFQSAAGIASLGRVRDALAAEADQLWAPRKAAEREYYIGAQKLELATTALKEATLRTRVWNEAQQKLDALQEAQDIEQAAHRRVLGRREHLERVRRVAPFRVALQALEEQLAQLGPVPLLPANAAEVHAAAQRELAGARQLLALRQSEQQQAQQEIDAIVCDDAVLRHAAEIVALDESRLLYGTHARDIQLRQREMAALWQDVGHAVRQLGWAQSASVDEEAELALRARLPSVLVRRTLSQRMRAHSGLLQTLQAAREASLGSQRSCRQLQERLAALPLDEVPPTLRAALASARALGDIDGARQRQALQVQRTQALLQAALQALAPWALDVPTLRALGTQASAAAVATPSRAAVPTSSAAAAVLPLPSLETPETVQASPFTSDAGNASDVSAGATESTGSAGSAASNTPGASGLPSPASLQRRLGQRQQAQLELQAARAEQRAAENDCAGIALELAQFMSSHQAVTQEDVLQARQVRDGAWSIIRSGDVTLSTGAAAFEREMTQADAAADARLDTLENATLLLGLRQRLQRRQRELDVASTRLLTLEQAQTESDADWAAFVAGLGLHRMPLEDMPDWLQKRQQALDADLELQAAQAAFASLTQAGDHAAAVLSAALEAAGQAPASGAQFRPGAAADAGVASLAALCLQAEAVIAAADAAAVGQRMLAAQLESARDEAQAQAAQLAHAQEALQEWSQGWSAGLVNAGLAADSELAAVEAAFDLFAEIERKLAEIRIIRTERIDTMRADLQHLQHQAQQLASALAPAMAANDGASIAQALAGRLQAARDADASRQRAQAAEALARSQMDEALQAIRGAEASLAPLMALAGVDSDQALALQIARADRQRRFRAEVETAQAALLHGGDGLTRAQIEAAVDAISPADVASELASVNDALSVSLGTQTALATELAHAQRSLAEFRGAATAAEAEARRQEALAQMADAAERFVKVHTAARLLRWSIERYREQKQGPMLARASAIFAELTLGSFSRLCVDFDKRPMALEGQRPDGARVGVSGMSDGTRDQLYLALRLAALELHLQQVTPLPFIADDLFVNYDDARSRAGLQALATLSRQTQVIFLTHHAHLADLVREVFGAAVNIVRLEEIIERQVQPSLLTNE